jgi:CRP-like cAMP-binding protein
MAAILAGRVRITMRFPEGKEMLLSMFERGEIFGERAVLDGMPRGADARAEGETTFLILPKEKIVPLLFLYPEAMFCIVQILCNRLSRYTETMQLLAFSDLTTRLASFILSLIPTYGRETEGKIVISSGHNQTDFAKKLGSARESVNRQMKAFVGQGLIEVHGDKITILDISSLERICGQPMVD